MIVTTKSASCGCALFFWAKLGDTKDRQQRLSTCSAQVDTVVVTDTKATGISAVYTANDLFIGAANTQYENFAGVNAQAAAVSGLALLSYDDEAHWFGDSGQRMICDPIQDVTLVDLTAVGDSFNTGFIAARLQGSDLRAAVHAGSSLAAQVIAKFSTLIDVDVSRAVD